MNTTSSKIGLPPGTLVHVGTQWSDEVKISVTDYTPTTIEEYQVNTIEEVFQLKEHTSVSWINIDGLHDTALITKLSEHFELDTLMMEDIINTQHRPKSEGFEDHEFITLKMLGLTADGKSIVEEQLSIILGKNWVISLQEKEGDIFHEFRVRVKDGKAKARKKGPDYLFYRLIDMVVDNYYHVTEHFGDTIEAMEESIIAHPDRRALIDIQQLNKKASQFRKAISPLREAILNLQKNESELLSEDTLRYIKDLMEHVVYINELIDHQKEMIGNLMDLYHSGVSYKMNQIMQLLTLVSTIFIPLTFIAGIYGMNFAYMPELQWHWGYFGVWGLMIAVAIVMVFYFKKKKWL
ncbi:magnesium/cobalt transporter CorA [Algivirga pacifica]|uniref:Magnesium transport protein CorA n=1 Tax=Algivirga pacifica TaxID=1162670 RepID=A0ABP9D6C2_9BACT